MTSPNKLYAVSPDPVTKEPKVSLNLHSGQTKVWDATARFVFMLAGTQCVYPDSRVWMADGTRKAIKLLVPGDKIINLNETTREIDIDTVTASFSSGIKETYKLTTYGGDSIIVTAEHPLYGIRGWTVLKKFRQNDKIMVVGNEWAKWDKIATIKALGEQEVWDITAERHHNFVAENIFCHNSGKALACDTPIPAPSGLRNMGDLVVGDQVYDDQRKPCTITLATPVMHKHYCYEVIFHDGAMIVADAEHLWLTNHGVKQTIWLAQAVTLGIVCTIPGRTITSVRPTKSVAVRCIQVDSPTHLYLAGKEEVVTHNTSFGPWWLWREIMQKGEGDYLAVTSTYDIFSLKMLPEMQTVFERVLQIGKYWSGSGIIEIKNLDPTSTEYMKFSAKRGTDPMWARIILRSASAEGGLESATAKAAWLDEVGQDSFSLGAWEAILRRLSLNQGRVLGTTTLYNMGWLKQQAYDPWVKGDKNFDIIQFDSTANPSFPQDEYDRAKANMPAWRFDLFYRGRFARPPGIIYGDYIEEIHCIPPFKIPAHWEHFVGIDFGAVHTATVWLAQDPVTFKFYCWQVTLEGDMSTKQHTDKFHERAKGLRIARVVGGAGNEEQFRLDWNAHNVPVEEPPFKDVENGIDRVVGLFKTDNLYVFNTLAGLRDELATYSRDVDKDSGEVLETIRDKNKAHRLDGLRYIGTVIGHDLGRIDPDTISKALVNRFAPGNIGIPAGELLSAETIEVLRSGRFDHGGDDWSLLYPN